MRPGLVTTASGLPVLHGGVRGRKKKRRSGSGRVMAVAAAAAGVGGSNSLVNVASNSVGTLVKAPGKERAQSSKGIAARCVAAVIKTFKARTPSSKDAALPPTNIFARLKQRHRSTRTVDVITVAGGEDEAGQDATAKDVIASKSAMPAGGVGGTGGINSLSAPMNSLAVSTCPPSRPQQQQSSSDTDDDIVYLGTSKTQQQSPPSTGPSRRREPQLSLPSPVQKDGLAMRRLPPLLPPPPLGPAAFPTWTRTVPPRLVGGLPLSSRLFPTRAPYLQSLELSTLPRYQRQIPPHSSSTSTLKWHESQTSVEGGEALPDCLSISVASKAIPPLRHWQEVSVVDEARKSQLFRICSYNVLCQTTIGTTRYLYRHLRGKEPGRSDESALEWNNRWGLLREEFRRIDADIFGLQEIQQSHFTEHFQPFFQELGYESFYKKRTGDFVDGCALFIRRSRFQCVDYRAVEFLLPNDKMMDRHNVGQLALLIDEKTEFPLFVTNTHILFNQKRGDIKLAQIALLIAHAHDMRKNNEPLVMLGDYNIQPPSALFHFIANGSIDMATTGNGVASGQLQPKQGARPEPAMSIPSETMTRLGISSEGTLLSPEELAKQIVNVKLKKDRPPVTSLRHPLCLHSSYPSRTPDAVSTFHVDHGNPDFIFYSVHCKRDGMAVEERIRLLRRLSLPSLSSLRAHSVPWPNHSVPSDHIPLVAEFLLF